MRKVAVIPHGIGRNSRVSATQDNGTAGHAKAGFGTAGERKKFKGAANTSSDYGPPLRLTGDPRRIPLSVSGVPAIISRIFGG